jgi:hypothetical protein
MNVEQLKKALPVCLKIGITPMIVGAHGIGKSQITRQIYESLGYKVVDIRLGTFSEASECMGLPLLNTKEKSTDYYAPTWFPRTPKTVIFFDEVNRANKDILQGIFQLTLDKELNGHKLPEDCHICCAMNPPTDDYSVVDFNDAAFNDRFLHIKFEPKTDEFYAFMEDKHTKENSYLSFLKLNEQHIEASTEAFTLDYVKPSRRSSDFASLLVSQNIDDKDLEVELLGGLVGLNVGVAYQAWEQDKKNNIIKPELIVNSLESVKKKIKEYSDPNSERRDVLGGTGEALIEFYKTNALNEKQANSVVEFLLLLPADVSYGLCEGLVTNDSNGNFGKVGNRELVDKLYEKIGKHGL